MNHWQIEAKDSRMKIDNALRIIDENIKLVRESKRELNQQQETENNLIKNQKAYLILVDELVYNVLQAFKKTKHELS
jgi:hypothetical protein|tara:strand:+ start:1018 stop:1248 length:231 start_codon:yes stop_codon:yes gene_type:complete